MDGNRFRISMLCCAALGTFGSSVLAQDTPRFKLYAGPAYVAPMSDSDVTLGAITDAVEAQEKVGWNLGGELRFGKWMGLEVDYVNATQDVSFGGETIGEADFSPLTATLNFHLVHTKVVDFYFGPSYSYINSGCLRIRSAQRAGLPASPGWCSLLRWMVGRRVSGLRRLSGVLDRRAVARPAGQ